MKSILMLGIYLVSFTAFGQSTDYALYAPKDVEIPYAADSIIVSKDPNKNCILNVPPAKYDRKIQANSEFDVLDLKIKIGTIGIEKLRSELNTLFSNSGFNYDLTNLSEEEMLELYKTSFPMDIVGYDRTETNLNFSIQSRSSKKQYQIKCITRRQYLQTLEDIFTPRHFGQDSDINLLELSPFL